MRFPWEDPSVSMFDVWIGQPELAWARKAWAALERRGLTLFSNELERTRVLIRAMALGTIYREFCDLAFDDAWDTEFKLDDDDDESGLLESALYSLIDDERGDICKALCEEFGGESMLFVSLCNSMYHEKGQESDPDDIDESPPSPDDVLDCNLSWGKLRAFSWISDRMPRVR